MRMSLYKNNTEQFSESSAIVIDGIRANAKFFSAQTKKGQKQMEIFIERLGRNSSLLPLNQLRYLMFAEEKETTETNNIWNFFTQLLNPEDMAIKLLFADLCSEIFIGCDQQSFLRYWLDLKTYTTENSKGQSRNFKEAWTKTILSWFSKAKVNSSSVHLENIYCNILQHSSIKFLQTNLGDELNALLRIFTAKGPGWIANCIESALAVDIKYR